MANPNDNIRRLYQNGLKHFSLPDFDTFQQDMKDEQKRKRFYNSMQSAYDLPDFDTFSQDIGAVAPPVPAQSTAQPQSAAPTSTTVQPVKDNTAQSAAVQPTVTSTAQPAQPEGWKPSPVQMQAMKDQMNSTMKSFQKTMDEGRQRMENVKKGTAFNASQGVREFNPQTGKMETAYYTVTGDRVASRLEQSRRNTEYNNWWYNNTEEGKRSKALHDKWDDDARQQVFDTSLAGLWQRNDPDNSAEAAWQSAESKYSAAVDRNRANADFMTNNFAMNSSDAVAIRQIETVDNFADRLTTHDLDALMDAAWNNLGEKRQEAIIDDCYQMLLRRYPGCDDIVAYNQAKELARQQSDLRMYNLAVAKNAPKNALDYFMRKVTDANLMTSIGKGLAVNHVGKTGDMAAYEAANAQYEENGHKVLGVAGTVTGMIADPAMLFSGGVGGLAGKGALWVGGRYMLTRGAAGITTKAATQAATRQFASSMSGRIAAGIVGGSANFGTYEGIKEAENQFVHGGHVVGMDDVGHYQIEDYSAGAIGKQMLHGAVMGAAIGWITPVSGNVSDALVRGTSNPMAKVGERAGVYTGATMLEGTIFSVPEWYENAQKEDGDPTKRGAMDVWTDNMTMMVGFKAKHILKSAAGVLSDLHASFEHPTNGTKNRLDFESRLRQRMDAVSSPMELTKDEKAELERYGYGDLSELVNSAEKTGNAAEGALITADAPRIVSRLTDMVTDSRVSEAARAKMYYYATGRQLPPSTIMYGKMTEDGKGGYDVKSYGANGVVTSRNFKSRHAADLELERIDRQAELNQVEIGERYQQTADFENRLQEASRAVAAENGWSALEVYRICEEARRNHLRGGDKQFNEAQQNILRKVTDAMGDFVETEVTDVMRGEINAKYGVNIDASIRKDASRRTEAEKLAVEEYRRVLLPDNVKERSNGVSDVEAEDITNQKRLTDENPGGDPTEPIDPRFEQPGSLNDIDPHKPATDTDAPKKAVGRATMKYQDRQVEVIDGRVVMTDDGAMVDNERSDRTIVIRDVETGKEEMVSPEAILTYEEYPEDSMEAAPAEVAPEAAPTTEAAAPAAESPKYTSGIIKVRNADGSESRGVLTGYLDEDGRHEYYLEGQTDKLLYASDEELDAVLTDYTPDAPKTEEQPAAGGANVVEYDNGRDAGLRDAAAMSDEKLAQEIDNLRNLGNLTDFGRGMLDGYEHVQQERQGMANPAPQPAEDAMPGTVPNSAENVPANSENVPNVPESGNTAGKNIPQNGNIAPENIPQTENPAPNAQPEQPQSALSRIPLDEKGKPNFAGAPDTDTAWDALVEKTNDEAMAQSYADNMVAAKEAALKKAEKAKTKPTEDLDEFMAAEQQRKNAITAAQNELATWQRIAGTSKRRSDAIRAQQEAEARAAAQARAEQEAVDKAAREEQERIEREALEGIPEWHLDTPENARKRGARRFQGQLFTRQEPLQGVAGKEIEVKFSQNDLPKGRVAVIDAAQLQPSHIQGNRNPMFFIEDAQPKNRAEQVSMMAAREIAEGIRPEEITGSATAYTGAPTVNTRGEVIQGNNRSDALRYLWENNLPEQQGKYRQYIIDNAAQFGLDPEAVANLEHPVLVNMLDVDDAEAVRLGMMTAQDTESGGVERIKPKNVAQKLGDGMRTFANMLLNSGDEDASFGQLVDRNGTEVLKWMAQTGAITGTQYRSAFDSKGNLTAEAKNDLQKVLYQAVFKGGSQQLEEMFDKLPAKAQRAILSTAFRDMDSPFTGRLLPELQASIVAYNELMTDPVFASAKKLEECLNAVEAYKRVLSLDDRFETVSPSDNFSNFAMHLAAMYKASDLSQSTLASYFNQMYDLAQGKKAATLFEEADTTEYPLAEVVNKVLGIDYQPAKNGNNNVANGGADVALHNQNGQGGELRGNEPPASGEQNPAGTEPSKRGAGTESDSSTEPAAAAVTESAPEEPVTPAPVAEKVAAAEAEVNTEPTEAQKEAGNYKKGHVQVGGFDITIEQPKGSVRRGKDANGNEWQTTMQNTYGYIRGTEGVDGDHIDVFLSDAPDKWNSENVYVVDQYNPDGTFDEHKVMLGFNDRDAAFGNYLRNYEDSWQHGRKLVVSAVSLDDFKKWIESSHRKTKPFADYKSVKPADEGTTEPEKPTAPETPANQTVGKGYKIEPKPYTNKQGKTLDTYLVTFDRDLSKEEMSTLRAKAKAVKGWYDRETGGWMLRSQEDARAFADEFAGKSEDEIADEAPLSIADITPAEQPKPADKGSNKPEAKASGTKKSRKSPINQVSIEDVFADLYSEGETKLSDHAKPTETEPPKPKKRRWISDEDAAEFDDLRNNLRSHLGSDDTIAQEEAASYGKPQPKQMDAEVLRMGTRMTYLMMKGGLRKFSDYAEAMIDEVGDAIRPHLKSLYAAAQNMEEVMQLGWDEEMDDRKTVKAFDVYNFDKPGAKDIIATAQHVASEQTSQQQTDQVVQSLKDQRNEQRKKEADEASADTEAIADKAEATASQVESQLPSARTEQDAERLIADLDKELEAVNEQLALLGYYEADTSDPSKFHESYGYMLTAEKKAVDDAARLTQQLAKDLGLDIGKIKSLTTRGKVNKKTFYAVRSNLAPACGDISICLPLNENAELHINISVEPAAERGGKSRIPFYGYADNLEVSGGYFRVENPNATGSDHYVTANRHFTAEVTYDDLLADIRRDTRHLLPEDEVRNDVPAEPQPTETPVEPRKKDEAYHGVVTLKDGREAVVLVANHQQENGGEPRLTDYIVGVKGEPGTVKISPYDIAHAGAPTAEDKGGEVEKPKADKKPSVEPEQTMGNLFGNLFDTEDNSVSSQKDNTTSKPKTNEKTDLQPRAEEAGRGRQQPRPNEPLGESAEHEDERPDGRGVAKRSGVHTVSDSQRSGSVSQPHKGERSLTEPKNTHNNHAERGVDYAPKGEKARIDANIAAIELARKLLNAGATATPKEMEVLRRYSGWGGLGAAFKEARNQWERNPINERLRQLLTPEEYDAAVMSRNSAYYTPAPVIDAMWDIAKALGFKGGSILEGSAGIGNIIGLMPADISGRSSIHAVEIDNTTGGILSLLYPDAKVEVQGFEKTKVRNGSVDLAITNVPFVTGLHVMDESGDSDLSKKFRDIHDFCIAKNVRKLREGGIGIFITSSGTLDKSQKLRDWLIGSKEGNADVVGVFRMHNQTFGGTAATSDIIVVRKRVNGRRSAHAIDVSTVMPAKVVTYTDDYGKSKDLPLLINRYFIEHPEHMGGEMFFGFEQGDSYRPTSMGLFPTRTADQAGRMAAWVKSLAEKDWSGEQGIEATKDETMRVNEALGEGVKEGSMVLDSNGELCVARMGRAVPLGINSNKVKGHTKTEVFNDYNEVKSALANVLKYQTEHDDDAGLQPLLDRLNAAYDKFVQRYGNFNRNKNIAWLRNNDIDYPSIAALETVKEKGLQDGTKEITYGKTDIFSRRVVDKESEPAPKNVKDGIIASIYKFGRIDTEYLAEQLGKSPEAIKGEIVGCGLGFEDPMTGQMEVSYEYLSGNVREKLRQAKEANESAGGAYNPNIKALEAVIPMNIPAHLIEFTLGSSWIDPKLYERYIKERTDLEVKLTNVGGTWHMDEPYYTKNDKNTAMGVRSEKLNVLISGHELIAAAITNKTITVSKTTKVGGESVTETDPMATAACAAKVDEIRQDFKDWARVQMQSDPDMSTHMEEVYNEQFNNSVPKTIPDDFVPSHFGGAATVVNGNPFQLRPHQAKAVIRATTQPVLLAHEVGTGKTYTLITTAMEMRRLGTARKPMIVVQNATVGQFVASAKALYPNAKILTLEDADRNEEGRMAFYAKIKYNDWDMIVVPQSVFERIPDSVERQTKFIEDKIAEKELVLEQMEAADPNNGRNPIVNAAKREIEKARAEIAQLHETGSIAPTTKKKEKDAKKAAVRRQNSEVKAREMLDRKTDAIEDFDSMGIDAVLVDEAHEYKHLGFATAMQRGVKGVDPSFSKKSQGVFLKVQSVLEKTGGKNVVFATGTPISNTAAEIWTFMRYLMPADEMKAYGIYYFDDFVRNFGNIQQMLEFTTSGKYKENNRFAGYVNLPELVRIWASVADTVLTREAGGVSDKIPQLEGGKAQDIYLPQTRALRSIMKYVKEQLDKYDKMSGKEKKANSHIPLVMYGIAKAAAVDARLVQEGAEDDPHSKTNEAVRQTLRTLEETKGYKGTVAIFADNYQNKATGFNLYEDIRRKLIANGIPAEQIVVMKSDMSVKKKLDIFDKVNSGEVRVIMGSTFTLGTGVNIQERLHTLIHLDAPNRPMDYTQRNGRLLRQGNMHNDWGLPVRILRFGVEDSLDVTAYQRLKTKGAIADSIMNGKQLMENSMESRSMEEDQDLFGDITAQLSGSEYAMLKNQIEKEVRKLTAKLKNYEADQTYIHNRTRQLVGQNKAAEERIAENQKYLAKVEAAVVDGIIVGKKHFASIDEMEDFFKEQNKKKAEIEAQVRDSYSTRPATIDITITVGGIDFNVHTEISREVVQNGVGTDLFSSAASNMTLLCPELGIKYSVWGNRIKNAVTDIVDNIISGKDFRERLEAAQQSIERNNAELKSMEARDGVPFQHTEELATAQQKLAEYEELMKKEMEEKEAKYADMDKEVEAAANIEYTEEDSETEEAGEPTPAYNPEKSSKFANSYETQDGKTVRYNSANPEAYAVSEPEDGAADSGAGRAGVQRKKDTPITTSNISGLNAAEGEFSLVDRQFTENKSFSFTSGARIKSADDVAFIFSALEDAAKEHSFVVYVKNGKPTVIELGMGTFNATMVDVPTASLAYNRIKPDQVYFVHNHPSGQLKCSPQDVQVLREVESMCDVPVLGVIINLKTGKYGTFDTSNNADVGVKRTPAKEHRLKVYTLDKQIFAPDYDPMTQPQVLGSHDVASFLNSHRMGDRAKVSFLILTRANRIVGNIHTPFTEISSNPREVARYISERVIQFGGENAILYGDFEMTAGASTAWQRVKTELQNVGKTRLLDVVSVMGNHTRSANDEGLLREPGSDYGAPDPRFREVEDEGVLSEFADGKTVKVYRTMQLIEGKLYSPMATKVNGVETPEIKLGIPEQSEEHPEIVKKTRIGDDGVEVGYIILNKGLGKGELPPVAYNPYIHTSRTVLNDQFTSAHNRPNLVTVEVEIPESELAGNYRAQYAKNSVGEMSWHSGPVSGQLSDLGRPRRVILTRYDKPVRILTYREVARMIAEQLRGTNIPIPYNVIQPQVRQELERLGVEISDVASGNAGKAGNFGKAEYITDREIERINAREAEKRQTSPEAKQEYAERLSKKFNTPIRIVTDVNELTHENPEIQAAMRRHKGFYDVRTGEVVVVVPNNADVEDVAESVFHEVVAHKGLREMIGEDNYDAFCDEIYDHLEDELKQKIDEETTRRFMNDPAKGHDYHRRVAVDEMFGRMSEKGFEDFTKAERGLWKKLKKKVLEAINKFLGSLKLPKWVKLGDNELRYILWRSHERLRSKGDYVDMARDAVKREELGLNDKTKPEPTESEKRARAMSRSKREFESTRDRAIREKGIVTPGLNDGEVRIVRVGQHPFSGDKPIKQAEAWAKAHLVGLHTATDSRGEEFEYSISKNKVEKQLSVSAVGRSENLGVHLAALTKLPEIISESIEAEIHPDYKKGADGQRKPENGVNNAALIHRFYGAAEIDGKIYRVKTTMEEFVDDNRPNTPHSFEVTKIELLEAPSASTDNGSGQPLAMTSNNSNGVQENASSIRNGALGTTKLLENVEKSYDAGKKLLDESGLAEEPTYEYRFRDGETGDIWNDQSIGFEERITNAAIRLSNNQSGDLTLRNDAMRAIGGNLTSLRRAMAAQKRYDQATVKRVADLARILMQNGYLSDMTSGEMQRLISAVKNAVGHTAVKESVQKIMDIMVNNQLRNGEATLRKLLTIRGSKVDARGVEVQGALDVDGQRTLEVVKKVMGLTEDDIANRIAEALNRMSDPDQTIADQAALEYAGLNMALDYVQNIAASKADEKALRDSIKIAKEDKDAGRMTDDAYKQFVEATEDAIRKNKIDRTEAYFNLVGRLSDSLRESIENAKAFREAEKARVNEIHHNANSDMEGRKFNEYHEDDWKDKFVNNSFVQFAFSPLATFDQILRTFGNKSASGEGYLWNRFMRGWVDCRNKELTGVKDKFAQLDAKVEEIFGKGMTIGKAIRLEAKLPKATVSFWDGGEMREHELTQGNLLYIYMVDKMSEGRRLLRLMGITDENIADIEQFIDPRYKALGDWIQSEFLVATRNEYNETHKRMFGASMAAIEDYFPFKVLANARIDKEEDVNQRNKPEGITTKTGSIVKRTRHNYYLDVTGADALGVVLDHIAEMEHWSAYAEWNRDINTLRTYKRFRNQVINMTTVYGGGRTLWNNFNDLCLMAAGEYRPPIAKLDKGAVNIAKGVTAAKVSFRLFTALKQLLSAPAYAPEVSTRAIAKSIANPYGDFKWCLDNLPIFRERWHSRISGDPRLLKSSMDWNMWRSRVMEIAQRLGMTPNAFVDAVTISIGARAMYETRLKQYLKEGYPADMAEKRAKQDATILFNQTQQSSESPFLSTMQVDRSWLSVLFTVFRNSAMSYTRQEFDALRNLKRNLTPGQRAESVAFMTKQILRDWNVDPDNATDDERGKAQSAARKRFSRQLKKDAIRLATFGFILEMAWNLGAYLPYILFGDDDNEKDKMWDDVITHSMFGSVEGLTGGDVISSFGNMWASGDWSFNQLSKDMPLASDINTIANKFIGGKNAEAVNDIINLIVQSGIGMNPQSITDAAVAITDACGDDPALSHEAAIFVMRVLQVPQSQIDKMYFDEVGLSGEETSKLTPEQLARRYAEYKVKRGTPFAPWSWGDEERLDKYKDAAETKIKERMEGQSDKAVAEAYADYEARYKAISQRMTDARALAKTDYVAAAQAFAELQKDPDLVVYRQFGALDKQLSKMSTMLLQSKTPEEAALLNETIKEYRAGMVKALQAETPEAQQSSISELTTLMNGFSAKYTTLRQQAQGVKR
jgi:N12 class adenine-specific DNA methylase